MKITGGIAEKENNLLLGFELEFRDGSVQCRVRLLKGLDVGVGYVVTAGIRRAKPKSFGCSVYASGKFCEASVRGHHRLQKQSRRFLLWRHSGSVLRLLRSPLAYGRRGRRSGFQFGLLRPSAGVDI